MSKCKEAYETLFAEPWMHERERSNLWKAAWNAATKNAVEICEGQMTGVNPVGDMAREECAEAIEKEEGK